MNRPNTAGTALILGTIAGLTPHADAQTYTIDWFTIDGGGTTNPIVGGGFALSGTIGQPDAGRLAGPPFDCLGGFWGGAGSAACYANCDGSTATPVLNVND